MQICIEELGTRVFNWFNLPVEQSDIDSWIESTIQPIYDSEKLGGIPEEFEVVDTDDINYLGSYVSIETYNQYFNLLEKNDSVVINYVMDNLGYSVEQIIMDEAVIEEQVYYESSLDEYVEQMIDDGMFGEINNSLRFYIDTDKVGRDLVINGDINEYSFDSKYYIFMNV